MVLRLDHPSIQSSSLSHEGGDASSSSHEETIYSQDRTDLLAMGRHLERSNPNEALSFYEALNENWRRNSPSQNAASLAEIENRLQVIRGEASLEERLPYLADHFFSEAFNPVMVGSFMVAGLANGTVRQGVSALLARQASVQFLRTGVGNAVAAGTTAYLAEVPSFVGAGRCLQGLIQPLPEGMEGAPLTQELFGAALFLGALKLSSIISGQVTRNLAPQDFSARAIGTSGTFAGIYGGQRLEENFELRPTRNEETRWVDTIHTFFQLQAGGRLAGSLMPTPRFLRTSPVDSPIPHEIPFRRLPALAANESHRPVRENLPLSRERVEVLRQILRQGFGQWYPMELFALTRDIGLALGDMEGFGNLLVQTSVRDSNIWLPALQRLHHMVRHAGRGGMRGNYWNWLSRLALERILENKDMVALGQLGLFTHQGSTLGDFEQVIAGLYPEYASEASSKRFSFSPLWRRASLRVFKRHFNLPLSLAAQNVLIDFLEHQRSVESIRLEEIPRDHLFHRFQNFLLQRPEMAPRVEGLLINAKESPVGFLRIHRLFRLMVHDPENLSKFLELEDNAFRLRPASLKHQNPSSPERIENSLFDAYLRHAPFTRYLTEFYQELRELTDVNRAREVSLNRKRILSEVWSGPRDLSQEDILRAFEALGDPLSQQVADSLRQNEVRILILEGEDFNQLARKYNESDVGDTWPAFFLPGDAQNPLPALVVRQIRNVSSTVFPDMVFRRLGNIIHEYEHFLETPQDPRTTSSTYREEMTATLRTLHWRARQGDIEELQDIVEQGGHSFAMTLRDRIENWYFPRVNGDH